MQCRAGCGACCIAPSISSPIPGMPNGKVAGERCIQLNDENLCQLFGHPDRPAVCRDFQPGVELCGENYRQAMTRIQWMEKQTGT